jgi:putative ABC transport system permease protein
MAADISYLSLVFLLLLLVPVFFLNRWIGHAINKPMLISMGRMAVQLALVGVYLTWIFTYDLWWLNALYVLLMAGVAASSALTNCRLRVTRLFFPVFLGILLPQAGMILFFNAVVVRLDHLFEAKYLIAVGSMLLSNVMNSNIVALRHFFEGLRKQEKAYQYALALGADRLTALMPWLKESVSAALGPVLARTATIGLVSLPGMMTGQILSGQTPLIAVKYQMAVMVAIFIAQYLSIHLTLWLCIRRGFDGYDMLCPDLFKGSKGKTCKQEAAAS